MAEASTKIVVREVLDRRRGRRGKALRDLTPGDFDAPPFSVGGGGDFDLSPDGKELAFASNRDADPAFSTNADVWTVPVVGDAAALCAPEEPHGGEPGLRRVAALLARRPLPRVSSRQVTPRYEADRFRIILRDRAAGAEHGPHAPRFDDTVRDFAFSKDGSRDLLHRGREGPDAALRDRPRDGRDPRRLVRRRARRVGARARRVASPSPRAAGSAARSSSAPRRSRAGGDEPERASRRTTPRSRRRSTSAPPRRSRCPAPAESPSRSGSSSRTASIPRRSTRSS